MINFIRKYDSKNIESIRNKIIKLFQENPEVKDDFIKLINPLSNQTSKMYYEGNEIKIILQDSSIDTISSLVEKNLPYLDLSNCEQKMKEEKYLAENDSLYSLNIIEKSNNSTVFLTTSNLMNSKGEILNHEICNNFTVNSLINSDLFNIKDYIDAKEKYGYDLFDPNDKFFNNICTPYDNKNGTDLTIKDRRNKFNKELYCRSLYLNGVPDKIDDKGYLSCNYKDLPQHANVGLETKIFDDLIKGNYELFLCIKLVFNEFSKNYGWYCCIIITTVSLIIIVLHSLIFEISKNTDKIFESDAITIIPVQSGYGINTDPKPETRKFVRNNYQSDCRMIHLKEDESDDIKSDNVNLKPKVKFVIPNKISKFNKKSSSNLIINKASTSSFTFVSNQYFIEPPLNVGTNKININLPEDIKNEDILSFDYNGNHLVNNLVNTKLENIKKSIYISYDKKIKLENCVSLTIEGSLNNKKLNSCKYCDIDNTILPQTLNDFSILNENLELDRDTRNFLQYFWDDFKQSQNILNLIFITSIIQPFFIRMLMFSLSCSFEFFFNALFFTFESISIQTEYKITKGKITILWKILNEIGQSIWPGIITAVIIGILNLFYSASEEDVIELKNGLLVSDNNLKEKAM